jgi:hypothetical protein
MNDRAEGYGSQVPAEARFGSTPESKLKPNGGYNALSVSSWRSFFYRFENWKLRRALALPYFLRSTTRLSRVRKPPCFKTGRSPGS